MRQTRTIPSAWSHEKEMLLNAFFRSRCNEYRLDDMEMIQRAAFTNDSSVSVESIRILPTCVDKDKDSDALG